MDPQEYERVYDHETRHFWYRGLHALALAQLRRALADRQDTSSAGSRLRVLDAGCGTGGTLERVAHGLDGSSSIGLDLSPLALDLARRRGVARLVRGSVGDIPLAGASVDAVLSLDVLYHRDVEDDRRGLAEMARVVRPCGVVLLNLPAHPSLASRHDRAVHGARRYTKARVRELAGGAGLEVERLGYWNAALFPALAAWRLATRGRTEHGERSDVGMPPRPVNAALAWLLRLEARAWSFVPLPFGLSLFAVLRRPPSPRIPPAREASSRIR